MGDRSGTLLSSEAVKNLQMVIQTIIDHGGVPGVVITSAWRANCTVADLREIFGMWPFAAYIIGPNKWCWR